MNRNGLCVCYLAREPEAYVRFLKAYLAHDAGMDHHLVLVGKGIRATRFVDTIRPPGALTLNVPDFIHRSLSAFRSAASILDCFETFCFLNSWSRPLVDGWLRKLVYPLETGVRISGATGSWESFHTNQNGILNRLIPPFPNIHLRTNALAMSRKDALRFLPKFAPFKAIEYLFEMGNRSITRRAVRCAVASSCLWYKFYQWNTSLTFRSGDQQDLLVADNQTDDYQNATPERKEQLRQITWGHA